MPSTLGYWKIRGFGQCIRLLLTYVEEEFEDELYEPGPGPEYNADCWFKEKKFNLGLDFPNLPYYMDGKVKITQSHTILRYIARKYNLGGETPEEQLRVDLMDAEIQDFRWAMVELCYEFKQKYEEGCGPYLEKLPARLQQFEDFLGDRPWFAGQKPTFVDFAFYEYLDMHTVFEPNCLQKLPRLRGFHDRVQSLPQIQKYMKSKRFISYPLWSPQAAFGRDDKRVHN